MRAAFEQACTTDDWLTIIRVAIAQAKAGEDRARTWLSPWIVGKVVDVVEHEVTGGIEHSISDQTLDEVLRYYANRSSASGRPK